MLGSMSPHHTLMGIAPHSAACSGNYCGKDCMGWPRPHRLPRTTIAVGWWVHTNCQHYGARQSGGHVCAPTLQGEVPLYEQKHLGNERTSV